MISPHRLAKLTNFTKWEMTSLKYVVNDVFVEFLMHNLGSAPALIHWDFYGSISSQLSARNPEDFNNRRFAPVSFINIKMLAL